ncbi:MAG: hypothetical protein NC094_08150 [Bacteroidales bacterium]|nr:hypothetical protein [Lachnoclostridium sp.]MCM1383134.1 hypothetical protein [Lachnoclostridium sp.]MCM1465374.1 hypothetical protein [Bacteroidales bacterium]
MTTLLELREKLKWIFSKNEVFILPVIKFLLAFIIFGTINGQMKYMTKLDNIAIVLVVALACSFLPTSAMIVLAAVFTILHMYALSMEVAAVGLCIYLLMFLLFFRFSPKDSLVVVLTPLLFLFKIPYVMPVAMGLIGGPASAVSVGCGVVVYFLLLAVTGNASMINTMGEEDAAAKIRLMINSVLANKQMMVVTAAFVITVIVVYLIRRMSMDYSWTIAMIAGAMTELVILLVGDLLYDINISIVNAILGGIVAILVGKTVEFFRFCVDYSRTEKVQFEDDEYYYYVKAVPKMTVTAQTNTVKKINTQRSSGTREGRSVTTERTGTRTNSSRTQYRTREQQELRSAGGRRSVTMNSNNMAESADDDYEEIF